MNSYSNDWAIKLISKHLKPFHKINGKPPRLPLLESFEYNRAHIWHNFGARCKNDSNNFFCYGHIKRSISFPLCPYQLLHVQHWFNETFHPEVYGPNFLWFINQCIQKVCQVSYWKKKLKKPDKKCLQEVSAVHLCYLDFFLLRIIFYASKLLNQDLFQSRAGHPLADASNVPHV